jgi:hypothetical protein
LSNRSLEFTSQMFYWRETATPRRHRPARALSLAVLVSTLSLWALVEGASPNHLRNSGFESSTPGEFWQVDKSEAKQAFSVSADRTEVKEGKQSLLIAADQPVHLTLRQEVFLPVGTLWRLTGWEKSVASPVSSAGNASGRGSGSKRKWEIRDPVGPQRIQENGSRRAFSSGFLHPAE